MHNPLSKTPFLFFLIPLVLGILLQYYVQNIIWSVIFSFVGGVIMLFSFIIQSKLQYAFRWLFGTSVFILFIALGGMSAYVKQEKVGYTLLDSMSVYVGYVTDTPQDKPRSVAHKIHLENENVDIVCYLQKDTVRLPLQVGDEIVFMGRLEAFKNAGNPDDFDYKKYMYDKGFSATIYLSSASWIATGKSHSSLSMKALLLRQKIMSFYTDLGFDKDEHAILSALTLGYQDTLSDDLVQAFRTTGTVHVLSVSGLHVGIIYLIISFLLSFISPHSRYKKLRPILTILLLWAYAFITGLPPSVVRASAMLSVFCMASICNRKSSSLNNLYIAAFLMLLYNPFQLFDIGFQLSYISVLSILLLHPRLANSITVKNKYGRYIWQMFTLSLVAQLATFPLCLYYFGTFPTYFFLANMLIVPLVMYIMYGVGFIVLSFGLSLVFTNYSEYIYWLPVSAVRFLVRLLTETVGVFEKLPFALIEGVELSLAQLYLLFLLIVLFLIAGVRGNSRLLIAALASTILFLALPLLKKDIERENSLIVYNRNGTSQIVKKENGVSFQIQDSISKMENSVFEMGEYKVLFVSKSTLSTMVAEELYTVDYAILVGSDNYTISALESLYSIPFVVLDSSLPTVVRQRLTKECENRKIPFYDVTKKGAFSIIF